MRLRPLALAACLALGVGTSAWAQTPTGAAPLQLTSSQSATLESLSTGAGLSLTTRGIASGLQLGEGAILHAAIIADMGYDTNVFYSSSSTAQGAPGAPVLNITPRLELTNTMRDGSTPSGTYYDLVAAVDFLEFLSNDSKVTSQNAIDPTASGTAVFSPGQELSLTLNESFTRSRQAPYEEGGAPIVRDDNMASASLALAPGGGRLRLTLRYTNLIDKYEGAYDPGSNMGNEGVLDIAWRWLPKTSLYVQIAQGAITYFNPGANNFGAQDVSSYPLRTLAGLRGLLTDKLSVNLAAGYNNAFYSSGASSPSGFGHLGGLAEINYTISLLSRVGVGYHHDFVNSPFLGGYYNMDAVYGAYQQMVASRLFTYLYARFEDRRYGPVLETGQPANVPTSYINDRTDENFILGAALDYMIGKFLLLGASYSLNLNRTVSGADPVSGGLNYTTQVVLGRIGAVY